MSNKRENTDTHTELGDEQLAEVSGGISIQGFSLQADDRMGNFEIQRLMSRYNQSEQLASSVQKKADDTANGVISKIG
jgi:hypothetical protein